MNVENYGIIQVLQMFKRCPGHMIFFSLEKEHQIGHSLLKQFSQVFVILRINTSRKAGRYMNIYDWPRRIFLMLFS
jgi:hypothetical protein